MKKAISYSLFGFKKDRHKDCLEFVSYLRGLIINIRMNRLLFPGWEIVVHIDEQTWEGYKHLFNNLPIKTFIWSEEPLCKAMLWRMHTIYNYEHPSWVYSHVLCRDLDGPPTYREAQAVQHWIDMDTCAHAITDSVSHCIPLLGGMIGFRPDYFTDRVANTWDELMNLAKETGIDFNRKGSDQDFLNKVIYPKVATKGDESIVQHYFNGHGDTFLDNYYHCDCPPVKGHRDNCHLNYKIDLPEEYKESNEVCGHIGSSGFYEGPMMRFLSKYEDKFEDLLEIEKQYPQIFYWAV